MRFILAIHSQAFSENSKKQNRIIALDKMLFHGEIRKYLPDTNSYLDLCRMSSAALVLVQQGLSKIISIRRTDQLSDMILMMMML